MAERGTVGLIGLGEMGQPMANRLMQGGWDVVGYDVQDRALEQAVAAGVQRAGSPAEVARAVDGTIVSIVRTLPQTEAVLFGVGGLVSANRPALDVAVMSTLNPAAMAQLAARAAGHGLTLVDAPVSGGRAGAEAGTLALMLAGEPTALERMRPVLERLGTNRFVLGERAGMGQAAKLANQVMLTAALLGVAEGLTLARSLGLDADTVLPIIGVSAGNSWAAQNWGTARRWWESYQPGTTLDILIKDLRSVQSCAADAGFALPVAACVLEQILGAWPPK
jgi:3-hydroxyisobutyrate dehydrogenase-like beta-hydroxyacid dehydrogenase